MSLENGEYVNTEYYENDEVQLHAVAVSECSQFTSWLDGNTDNPRKIVVTGTTTYDVNFDNKMDGVAITTIGRLYAIDSDSANASIEYYKRAFPPDGAYSLLFKEWEEGRKSLRPKRKSDVREPKTTTISPRN